MSLKASVYTKKILVIYEWDTKEYATCHLYILWIHTYLKAHVCTEDTSDLRDIPWYPTQVLHN